MEQRAYEIFSHVNREISVRVIPGHFATKHSHVSHCIDMTQVKSQINSAKAAAKILADSFVATPVDTIICLERMKMVGAFMADYLTHSAINLRNNIAVITPEVSDYQDVGDLEPAQPARFRLRQHIYGNRRQR